MPPQVHKSGRRQEQKARTQQAILAAARDLFHRHGFEVVTVRQIAKTAGVSTGSMFATWPTKMDVFEAAMGCPAPDIEAFLLKVSDSSIEAQTDLEARAALTQLGIEADRLRNLMVGVGG